MYPNCRKLSRNFTSAYIAKAFTIETWSNFDESESLILYSTIVYPSGDFSGNSTISLKQKLNEKWHSIDRTVLTANRMLFEFPAASGLYFQTHSNWQHAIRNISLLLSS